MDIYRKRSLWNVILLVVGILILLITVIYANYLASQLSEREAKSRDHYRISLERKAQNPDLEIDITLEDLITRDYSLPIIMEIEGLYLGNNWGEAKDTSQVFLKKKVKEYLDSGQESIEVRFSGGQLYPFKSKLSTYIQYFPLAQFILLGFFIALGYYLFNAARRGEQNRVWAGMAKETAHQLGTPISAIIAWIEYLKETNEDRPAELEVLGELRSDVTRLELIADRFSKIGSEPELEQVDVFKMLKEIETYMKKRSPRKVSFDFPDQSKETVAMLNEHLFSWVLENLIRNSLDAMDGSGVIKAQISQDQRYITIDISDTGKGIPASKHKEVFRPGYSTKLRGWGLGLSLAKRIIEQYHKGKIFVKSSKVNEGTTFSIQLPRV